MSIFLRYSLLLILLLFISSNAFAQSGDVYNNGTLIRVAEGAILSIGGNYVDNSGSNAGNSDYGDDVANGSRTLDAPVFLSGTLYVGGDIINNNDDTNTKLIYTFEKAVIPGKVVMNGSGLQSIKGKVDSYFPNLQILNTGLGVYLERNIQIDNNFTLTSGLFNLNGKTVLLRENGRIIENPEATLIFGTSGVVQSSDRDWDAGSSEDDFIGIGLGYSLDNNENFSKVAFSRIHNSSSTPYPYPDVANGVTTVRSYRMKASDGPPKMSRLRLYYGENEFNNLSENNLALYASKDDGQTWINLTSFVNMADNYIEALDVEVISDNSYKNIFVLAAETCAPGKAPDITLSSTGAGTLTPGTPGPPINPGTPADLKICEKSDLTLSIPSTSPYYQWTTPRGVFNTNSYSRTNVDLTADNGDHTILARNTNGCRAQLTVYVDVRSVPIASFTITPNAEVVAVCRGTEMKFTDTSIAADGSAITQWRWKNDNELMAEVTGANNNAYIYPTHGRKHPSLIVTSQYGCISPIQIKSFSIESLPIPEFEIKNDLQDMILQICEDKEVHLKNKSTYEPFPIPSPNPDNEPGGIASSLTYQWKFGDDGENVGSTKKDTVHVYDTFRPDRKYYITLIAKANPTQCMDSVKHLLYVNPEPVPMFTPTIGAMTITEACEGIDIRFANSSTMPLTPGMTYEWIFDNKGTSSTDEHPIKQFGHEQTQYDVTLTATSTAYGCYESITKPVIIHPAPEGTFTVADTDICIDDMASFTNGTSIASGEPITNQWQFGDGNTITSSTTQIDHLYTISKQYTVKLKRTSDYGCSNSVSRNITVHPKPVVAFQQVNVCDQKDMQFYNTSVLQSGTITDYLWTFGDTKTSTEKQPAHKYLTSGDYTVTLKGTSDYGCVNKIVHPVKVYQNPFFNLGASITACTDSYLINPDTDGSPTKFLPNLSTYSWSKGGVVISNNDQLTVNTSGVYTVHVTTPSPESCQADINVPVFLFKPVALGGDRTACAQVILDAEEGLIGEKSEADETFYQWKKAGVIISSAQVLTATQSGDYELTLTRKKAGVSCSSSDDIHIEITLPISLTLPAEITKCQGETVLLDAGAGAQTYKWINLNTGAVVGNQSTLNVIESGLYQVNVDNGTCQATAVCKVIFSPKPEVSFTISSTVFCSSQSIMFTDASFTDVGEIVDTQWDFGDNTTASNQLSVVKTYASPGVYPVTLTATTVAGCSAVFPKTITINETPVADFIIADACQGETLAIQNLSSTSGTSFQWDFNSESASSQQTPVFAFDTPGQKQITLKVLSSQGCTATVSHTITIHAQPVLNLGNVITTCGSSLTLDAFNSGATYRWFDPQNSAVTLSSGQQFMVSTDGEIAVEITSSQGCQISEATSVSLNTPIVINLGSDRTVCDEVVLDAGYFPAAQFNWSNGETTRTIEANQSSSYSVSVTDQNGCSGSATVTLDVKETPVINSWLNNQSICEGESLLLVAGTTNSFDYLWSTGATTHSLSVSTPGNYQVTVSNGLCTISENTFVNVNQSPVADFNADAVCSGNTLSFNNTSVDSGDLTYHWDLGDGSFSASESPKKIYNSPGIFQVTLTVQNEQQCSSEITRSINVRHVPVASFIVANSCTLDEVGIANTSSYTSTAGISYQWTSGNGDSYTEASPAFIYPNAGTYLITLQATTSEGCSDAYVQEVVIGTTPSLSLWETSIATCNSSLTLDAGNTGSFYLWSDQSTQQTLQVQQSGTYLVEITSAEGCSATASVDVTFNNQVQPLLDDTMQGCGSVFIDPKVEAATYLWSTGEQTKTINVTESKLYSVQIISTQLCISNDATNVTVNPVPVFELGNDINSCAGQEITLQKTVTIPVSYKWSTLETTSSINVVQTGKYSLKLTTPEDCSYEDNVNVTFHELPVLDFASDISNCGELKLDAKNTGSTYLWSTGSKQQVISITASGDYSIEVTNSHACKATEDIAVTILDVPTVNLGADIVVCNGQTALLDAGTSATNYSWSDQSRDRYLKAGSTGDYAVTIKGSNGCIASDNIRVTVRPSLGLELGADRLLCNNAGAFLSAGVNNVKYQWGSSTGFTSQEKDIRPGKTGKYWVTIKDVFGCTMSDSVTVSPTTENIEASFLIPSVVGQGEIVQFAQLTESNKELKFSWKFGDGGFSTEKNPTHRYFSPGEYEPELTVSNGICSDTLRKSITIIQGRFESDPGTEGPQFIDIINASVDTNPAGEMVEVNVALTTETKVIVGIYSLQGVLLREHSMLLQHEHIHFDLSSLSQGIYLVRIMAGNKVKVLRLMKSSGN